MAKVLSRGNKSLCLIEDIEAPDVSALSRQQKEKVLNKFIKQVLEAVDEEAGDYVLFAGKFYGKENIDIKQLKNRLILVAGGQIADTFGHLTRPLRSRTVEGGERHESGNVARTKKFADILDGPGGAIEELEELLSRQIDYSGFKSAVAGYALAIFSLAAVAGGLLISSAANHFVVAAGLYFILILACGIFLRLVADASRNLMLIYPAKDMRSVCRDYQRLIYNSKTQDNLRVIDIRRFLIQIRAALTRLREEDNDLDRLQDMLDAEETSMRNLRDSGIARSFLNAFHLIKLEKWTYKLGMLFKLTVFLLFAGLLSYAAGLLFISGATLLQRFLSFEVTGFIFQRGFAISEALKLLRSGYPLRSLEVWGQFVLFAAQIFFGILVVGSATLFMSKFTFYYIGKIARLYPWQKNPAFYIKRYTAGIIVSIICLYLLQPTVGALALIIKFLFAVELIRCAYMLFIHYKAKDRFKAIASDDKLYDGENESLNEESFNRFMKVILERYTPDDLLLINQAAEMKRQHHDTWKDRLTPSQRRDYELLLGKGAVPSGLAYEELSLKSLNDVYSGLDKKQLLERMSAAGFQELKDYLSQKGKPVDAALSLWKVQHVSFSGLEHISAADIRDFLDISLNEKKIIMAYDFLPKMTSWIVAVASGEAILKLLGSLLEMRYPLKRSKFIFAGESWSHSIVIDMKKRGEVPPQLIYRSMAVREDGRKKNVMPEHIRKSGWVRRLRWRLFEKMPQEPAQPYTKPGANTAVLHESDGVAGIIYDAENIPNQNQFLQFVLGTMEGITRVRELSKEKFMPAMEKLSSDKKFVIEESHSNKLTLKRTKSIITKTLKSYNRSLNKKDLEVCYRFNLKKGSILKRHFRYFANNTLKTLFELESKGKKYLSTGILWAEIMRLDAALHEPRQQSRRFLSRQLRQWLNLYITLATMPGYGHVVSAYLRDDIDRDTFIKFLIAGEFKRINEPKNGQGRLAKINNALHTSKTQVAAYMFGEYASWYTAGWDGLHACQDTFKPLGGTTGYFCTEPVEEVYWQQEKIKKIFLAGLDEAEIESIKTHYNDKNKLLAIGGWDEFQVAEDYMLGMVLWWRGFNVAAFWSLTPEDPAGFESELGFKFRPKQISRWNKGYIMGLLMVIESWRNFSEMGRRKGLWGYLTFFIATLCSAVQPFIFRIAVAFSLFWWIYFLPIRKTWEALLGSRLGTKAATFNDYTGVMALLEKIQKSIGIYTPRVLNFFSVGGWAWVIGPALVFVPLFIYRYFTMRGIFKGVDDYVGLKRILQEYDHLIAQLRSMAKEANRDRKEIIQAALEEIRKRKEVVSLGSLEEVRGVVSLRKYLLLACFFLGSCVAIFVSPALVLLLPLIIGISAVMYFIVMLIIHLYLYSAGDEIIKDVREKAVRAMRLRAAMPNFFIDFYHMIYLAGNKIAWREVINGGRIGYWWRTPRAVDIIDEAILRHEGNSSKNNGVRGSVSILGNLKNCFNQAEIETNLEELRLNIQLYKYYGFMLLMSWILVIGLRYGVQDYIFSQMLFQTLFREVPATQPVSLMIVAGLLALLIAWKVFMTIKKEHRRWANLDDEIFYEPEKQIKPAGPSKFVAPLIILLIIGVLIQLNISFKEVPAIARKRHIENPAWLYSSNEAAPAVGIQTVPQKELRTNFELNIGSNIKGSFHDVGRWRNFSRAGWSTRQGASNLEKQLRSLAANGANLIRYMPVLGDLRSGVSRQGGYVVFDDAAREDVAVFFYVLDKVREDYPELQIIPTLFSFEIADGISREDGAEVGEWPEIFKDPSQRNSFIGELNYLFGGYWNHEGIYAWDIFNEPNLAWQVEIEDIQAFVEELAPHIHDAGGNITVGCQTLDNMVL